MVKVQFVYILTAIFFISLNLYSQTSSAKFNLIDIDQGLSQNEVNDILQDSRGFMWFATYSGLNRYDGYDFKIYSIKPDDSTSLKCNKILSLYEDHKGVLWVGTSGGGLSRFNREEENFTTFMNVPDDKSTLPDNLVLTVYEDSKYRLWIGTNRGLSLVYNDDSINNKDKSNKISFINFLHNPSDSLSISDNGVMKIFEDSKGNLWFTTVDGLLNKLIDNNDQNNYRFKKFNSGLSYSSDAVYVSIDHIMEDRNHPGFLWLAVSNAGLIWFDSINEKFFYKYPYSELPSGIPYSSVWNMCWTTDNELFLGTFGSGIYSFILEKDAKKVETFEHYQFQRNNSNLTEMPDVQIIFEDRTGMVWFGTRPNGLYTLVKRTKKFENFVYDPANKNSLISDYDLSVLETYEGNIWIGTAAGLDVFNSKRSKLFSFYHKPEFDGSISANTIYCIHQDIEGNIWVGTPAGLDKYLPISNSFKHFKNDPSDSGSISFGEVIRIFSDSNGTLWIGTWNGGLNKYIAGENGQPGHFLHYIHDPNDLSSISNNRIMSIAEDNSGSLWIGTSEGGLNKLVSDITVNNDGSLSKPKFNRYKFEPGNMNSLSNNDVRTIFIDKDNNIWLGTFGGGLNKIILDKNGEPDRFIHYTEEDGLAHDVVRGILEDDEGNLWISTANGLSKFNPETMSFMNFGSSDGLQTAKFQDAYYKSKTDGRFYFGGVGGVVSFIPGDIKTNNTKPEVVITSFKRFTSDGNVVSQKGISEKKEIYLSYNDKIISFEFAALSFNNTFKNNYAYLLEGYDDNWINTGTKRDVTFTNLDPGNYVLKIIGSNEDGVWSDKPAMIKIFISSPWWSTYWAYSLYGIFFLGILYGIRRYELNRRLEKEEKKILQLENDRKTGELEQARKLQLSMLPKEVPHLANLDVSVYIKTATEVGGDYYDFYKSETGELTAVIGDATGHSLNAGMLVSVTKGLFQNLASKTDLNYIISQFNQSLYSMKLQPMYMSLSLLRISGKNLQVVGCGMPPVLFYKCSNDKVLEIESSGPPLGGFPDFRYEVCNYNLSRGDIILLMSDGFVERRNSKKEIFGWEKPKILLAEYSHLSPQEIINELDRVSNEWGAERSQDDDISFIVFKIK